MSLQKSSNSRCTRFGDIERRGHAAVSGKGRQRFPPAVAEQLDSYVYLLIDPREKVGSPDRI